MASTISNISAARVTDTDPRNVSITDKANAILNRARQIEMQSSVVLGKVMPPVPAAAGAVPEPTPDHLVFILEAAAAALANASDNLESINSRL